MEVPPPGRPRLGCAELAQAREAVEAELDRQGWKTGEGPVHRALGGDIPLSRVRRVMRELKAERRQRKRKHEEAARISMKVAARDAVWSIDATHLGRNDAGGEVQSEVLREVRSTRTIGLTIGKSATAKEVVALLERTAKERGGPPLVLLSDNGGPYRSGEVGEWCERNKVIHLFSLPYTPQHNAASEHGMRELKEDASLGKGVLLHDIAETRATLQRSRDRIDGHRLRRTRNWMTAVEFDQSSPHWETLVTRKVFWQKATCAINRAVLDSSNQRDRRRAVRKAILTTLNECSVITLTRGGRRWTAHDAEGN